MQLCARSFCTFMRRSETSWVDQKNPLKLLSLPAHGGELNEPCSEGSVCVWGGGGGGGWGGVGSEVPLRPSLPR